MKWKYLAFLFLVIHNSSDITAQLDPVLDQLSFECQAKGMRPALIQEYVLYEYFGTDPDVETTKVEVYTKASTKWEETLNQNCEVTETKDCMVWCAIDIPADTLTINAVNDTSATKDWQVFTIQETIDIGGYDDINVVCKRDMSKEFLERLSQSLNNLGFNIQQKKKFRKLDGVLLEALHAFQNSFNLTVGALTEDTYLALIEQINLKEQN